MASGAFRLHNSLAPVVRRLDNAIHWIKLYPVDNAIRFAITYPPDSDLSVGWRYPPFKQLGPYGAFVHKIDGCAGVDYHYHLFSIDLDFASWLLVTAYRVNVFVIFSRVFKPDVFC